MSFPFPLYTPLCICHVSPSTTTCRWHTLLRSTLRDTIALALSHAAASLSLALPTDGASWEIEPVMGAATLTAAPTQLPRWDPMPRPAAALCSTFRACVWGAWLQHRLVLIATRHCDHEEGGTGRRCKTPAEEEAAAATDARCFASACAMQLHGELAGRAEGGAGAEELLGVSLTCSALAQVWSS